MSEMKHTPGPWLFRGKSSSVHRPGDHLGCTYDTPHIHFAEDDDGRARVSDADLALILASPDLLAACEAFVAIYKSDEDAGPEARLLAYANASAAIAKARGGA